MDYKQIFNNLNIQAEELFQKAIEFEFFGLELFENLEQNWYQIPNEVEGDSCWLVKETKAEHGYKIMKIGKDMRKHVTPSLFFFHHCEKIPDTWLDDRRKSDIELKIKNGGAKLGAILNKAYINVLVEASSSQSLLIEDEFRETLANLYSTLVRNGFDPNTFIFPKHLEAKLVNREIIVRDKDRENSHYVGTIISGQAAYWSRNLPDDTGILFDSSIGITIFKEPTFRIGRLEAFTPGVCGYFNLNPIVINTQGIIALTGIENALDLQKPQGVITMDQFFYVDLERIEQLRKIEASNFDLIKLIKLCEEINICFRKECYLAVAALTRNILDHVPPIFGFNTFQEVANNYGGRSIKKNLQNLQISSRNISDTHLHQQIRKNETLPNKTQVNFSNDLDVLLAEIVNKLK